MSHECSVAVSVWGSLGSLGIAGPIELLFPPVRLVCGKACIEETCGSASVTFQVADGKTSCTGDSESVHKPDAL